MEEPENVSETTVTHGVKVGGETLDGSVVCGGHNEVVCGDSVGVVGGTEYPVEESRVVEFEEAGSENAAAVELGNVVLGGEVRDEAVVGSTVIETTIGDFNLVDAAEAAVVGSTGVETTIGDFNMVDAAEAADHKIINTSSDDALAGSSVGEENVQCFSLEKCNSKEQLIADNDVSGVSALDAQQSDVHEEIQIDGDNQQGTERNETVNHTAEVKGSSVSIETEENLDANAIVEEDTQDTDQGSHAPLRDGKEKVNEESNGGQEIEKVNEVGKRKLRDRKAGKHALVKPGSSEIVHQARYLLPKAKEEGEFSLSDMVWGKVRSHPWWPGQIFDPSDASERAKKHYKKDCYFVAYFGDKTFAWNEASKLKHFRAHFSTIEEHRNRSESFQSAINCALDEVSRRVEYGLACSCIPKDTYDMIKSQTVENTGVQQEISITHEVDESLNADSFSPLNLIEYVKTLSEFPTAGFDRLELVTAKAQLLAFNRFKGFSCLPEIQHCGGVDPDHSFFVDDEQDLCEDTENATPVVKKGSNRQKRKYKFKDTVHPSKKEKRMSDLMNGTPDSPDGDGRTPDNLVSPEHSKKRSKSAIDPYADDSEMQDGRKTISVAKVSNTTKSSFKIGDCIRRAASQLTASPSIRKCSSDRSPKADGDFDVFPDNESDVSLPTDEDDQDSTEYSSLDDLLSSLQLVAQEPLGEYTFLNGSIVSFFSDFRNSVVVAADWKEILRTDIFGIKRKKPPIVGTGSPETFEFEDMSDTYWTDRVIDNGTEEKPAQQKPVQQKPVQQKPVQQPSRKNQKKDEQPVSAKSPKPAVKSPKPASKSPKPAQVNRKPYTKKNNSESNPAEAPEKPPGYIDDNAPAELVMNFAELNSVPLEANLNKMFKRFGPLKESETEVDRVSSRARVVFKKCVDAEVAFNSAKKFNIFGSVLVNYQLNYTPSALFKASSVDATQDQEMVFDLSNFEVNMV